jgi:protein-L-isoaspartate O-methyltransferase
VHLIFGDGMLGYPKGAPYAGIISAAGGDAVPQAWLDQLAVGGRLIAPTITPEQLQATLQQASNNLFSSGRNNQGESQLTIYARTVVHPREGLSKPIYLGFVKRSMTLRDDPNVEVKVFTDKFAELPKI